VDKLLCGKKGIILSNSEDIGHRVFVRDADIGTTIKTTIKEEDICPHCGKSHLEVRELPQHWIGKKLHVRPYQIYNVQV
jgi:hypothetical protein